MSSEDAFVSVESIRLLECRHLPCNLILYMFIFFSVIRRRLEESELGHRFVYFHNHKVLVLSIVMKDTNIKCYRSCTMESRYRIKKHYVV